MQKIMFSDKYDLTKAVLEGRKTMTRRLISEDVWQRADVYRLKYYNDTLDLLPEKRALIEFSPFKVGEVVAVAQAYKNAGFPSSYIIDEFHPNIEYEAGWNNKMFVRADLMPHQICITNVRVERLQDISDEDCLQEGVQAVRIPKGCVYVAGGATIHDDACKRIESGEIELSKKCSFDTPRDAFATLIDKASGRGTWESNPMVFVYEFELVE